MAHNKEGGSGSDVPAGDGENELPELRQVDMEHAGGAGGGGGPPGGRGHGGNGDDDGAIEIANRIAEKGTTLADSVRDAVGRGPGGERLTLSDLPSLATTERSVTLRRAEIPKRPIEALWWLINAHTEAISFPSYSRFISRVLCDRRYSGAREEELRDDLDLLLEHSPVPGSELYQLLKQATEAFLLLNCGSVPQEPNARTFTFAFPKEFTDDLERLRGERALSPGDAQLKLNAYLNVERNSYLTTVINGAFPGGTVGLVSPFCVANGDRIDAPCLLELIWSYWMEEGMLVQTIAALTRRFQNVRSPGRRPDPLAEFELDTLRPLSGFLWGYLQDEPNRLSVLRRAYEYSHHYGITLYGRAVPPLRAADARVRFLEAFHNLLRQAATFYKEDSDTTVIADAFPVLTSLKEVHLILSEGAHNQFRDLPWQSRAEMLLQMWLLSLRQMKDFLRGRFMIAYPESWMGAVDAMKRLQGWTDTSVLHFRDLARFGERILLSIRYGNWSAINSQDDARAWLRYWKDEIQGYIHAYHTATGVMLADDIIEVRGRADQRAVQPSYHLRNRLLAARRAAGPIR